MSGSNDIKSLLEMLAKQGGEAGVQYAQKSDKPSAQYSQEQIDQMNQAQLIEAQKADNLVNASGSVASQRQNLEAKMQQVGVNPEQFKDNRNPIEKMFNVKPNQNWLFDVFEVISRPQQALFGAVEASQNGEDAGAGFMKGLTGGGPERDIVYGGEILRNAGMGDNILTHVLGFAADVFLDPADLAFLPVGAVSKGTQAFAKLAGKADDVLDTARMSLRGGVQIFETVEENAKYVKDGIKMLDDALAPLKAAGDTSAEVKKLLESRNVLEVALTKLEGDTTQDLIQDVMKQTDDALKALKPKEQERFITDVMGKNFNLIHENEKYVSPTDLVIRTLWGGGKSVVVGADNIAMKAATAMYGSSDNIYKNVRTLMMSTFNPKAILGKLYAEYNSIYGSHALFVKRSEATLKYIDSVITDYAEKTGVSVEKAQSMVSLAWVKKNYKPELPVGYILRGDTVYPYTPEQYDILIKNLNLNGKDPMKVLPVVSVPGEKGKWISTRRLDKSLILEGEGLSTLLSVPELLTVAEKAELDDFLTKPEFGALLSDFDKHWTNMMTDGNKVLGTSYQDTVPGYLRNTVSEEYMALKMDEFHQELSGAQNSFDSLGVKKTDTYIGNMNAITPRMYPASSVEANRWAKADKIDFELNGIKISYKNPEVRMGSDMVTNANKTTKLPKKVKEVAVGHFRTGMAQQGETLANIASDSIEAAVAGVDSKITKIPVFNNTIAGIPKKSKNIADAVGGPEMYNILVEMKKTNPDGLKVLLKNNEDAFNAVGDKPLAIKKATNIVGETTGPVAGQFKFRTDYVYTKAEKAQITRFNKARAPLEAKAHAILGESSPSKSADLLRKKLEAGELTDPEQINLAKQLQGELDQREAYKTNIQKNAHLSGKKQEVAEALDSEGRKVQDPKTYTATKRMEEHQSAKQDVMDELKKLDPKKYGISKESYNEAGRNIDSIKNAKEKALVQKYIDERNAEQFARQVSKGEKPFPSDWQIAESKADTGAKETHEAAPRVKYHGDITSKDPKTAIEGYKASKEAAWNQLQTKYPGVYGTGKKYTGQSDKEFRSFVKSIMTGETTIESAEEAELIKNYIMARDVSQKLKKYVDEGATEMTPELIAKAEAEVLADFTFDANSGRYRLEWAPNEVTDLYKVADNKTVSILIEHKEALKKLDVTTTAKVSKLVNGDNLDAVPAGKLREDLIEYRKLRDSAQAARVKWIDDNPDFQPPRNVLGKVDKSKKAVGVDGVPFELKGKMVDIKELPDDEVYGYITHDGTKVRLSNKAFDQKDKEGFDVYDNLVKSYASWKKVDLEKLTKKQASDLKSKLNKDLIEEFRKSPEVVAKDLPADLVENLKLNNQAVIDKAAEYKKLEQIWANTPMEEQSFVNKNFVSKQMTLEQSQEWAKTNREVVLKSMHDDAVKDGKLPLGSLESQDPETVKTITEWKDSISDEAIHNYAIQKEIVPGMAKKSKEKVLTPVIKNEFSKSVNKKLEESGILLVNKPKKGVDSYAPTSKKAFELENNTTNNFYNIRQVVAEKFPEMKDQNLNSIANSLINSDTRYLSQEVIDKLMADEDVSKSVANYIENRRAWKDEMTNVIENYNKITGKEADEVQVMSELINIDNNLINKGVEETKIDDIKISNKRLSWKEVVKVLPQEQVDVLRKAFGLLDDQKIEDISRAQLEKFMATANVGDLEKTGVALPDGVRKTLEEVKTKVTARAKEKEAYDTARTIWKGDKKAKLDELKKLKEEIPKRIKEAFAKRKNQVLKNEAIGIRELDKVNKEILDLVDTTALDAADTKVADELKKQIRVIQNQTEDIRTRYFYTSGGSVEDGMKVTFLGDEKINLTGDPKNTVKTTQQKTVSVPVWKSYRVDSKITQEGNTLYDVIKTYQYDKNIVNSTDELIPLKKNPSLQDELVTTYKKNDKGEIIEKKVGLRDTIATGIDATKAEMPSNDVVAQHLKRYGGVDDEDIGSATQMVKDYLRKNSSKLEALKGKPEYSKTLARVYTDAIEEVSQKKLDEKLNYIKRFNGQANTELEIAEDSIKSKFEAFKAKFEDVKAIDSEGDLLDVPETLDEYFMPNIREYDDFFMDTTGFTEREIAQAEIFKEAKALHLKYKKYGIEPSDMEDNFGNLKSKFINKEEVDEYIRLKNVEAELAFNADALLLRNIPERAQDGILLAQKRETLERNLFSIKNKQATLDAMEEIRLKKFDEAVAKHEKAIKESQFLFLKRAKTPVLDNTYSNIENLYDNYTKNGRFTPQQQKNLAKKTKTFEEADIEVRKQFGQITGHNAGKKEFKDAIKNVDRILKEKQATAYEDIVNVLDKKQLAAYNYREASRDLSVYKRTQVSKKWKEDYASKVLSFPEKDGLGFGIVKKAKSQMNAEELETANNLVKEIDAKLEPLIAARKTYEEQLKILGDYKKGQVDSFTSTLKQMRASGTATFNEKIAEYDRLNASIRQLTSDKKNVFGKEPYVEMKKASIEQLLEMEDKGNNSLARLVDDIFADKFDLTGTDFNKTLFRGEIEGMIKNFGKGEDTTKAIEALPDGEFKVRLQKYRKDAAQYEKYTSRARRNATDKANDMYDRMTKLENDVAKQFEIPGGYTEDYLALATDQYGKVNPRLFMYKIDPIMIDDPELRRAVYAYRQMGEIADSNRTMAQLEQYQKEMRKASNDKAGKLQLPSQKVDASILRIANSTEQVEDYATGFNKRLQDGHVYMGQVAAKMGNALDVTRARIMVDPDVVAKIKELEATGISFTEFQTGSFENYSIGKTMPANTAKANARAAQKAKIELYESRYQAIENLRKAIDAKIVSETDNLIADGVDKELIEKLKELRAIKLGVGRAEDRIASTNNVAKKVGRGKLAKEIKNEEANKIEEISNILKNKNMRKEMDTSNIPFSKDDVNNLLVRYQPYIEHPELFDQLATYQKFSDALKLQEMSRTTKPQELTQIFMNSGSRNTFSLKVNETGYYEQTLINGDVKYTDQHRAMSNLLWQPKQQYDYIEKFAKLGDKSSKIPTFEEFYELSNGDLTMTNDLLQVFRYKKQGTLNYWQTAQMASEKTNRIKSEMYYKNKEALEKARVSLTPRQEEIYHILSDLSEPSKVVRNKIVDKTPKKMISEVDKTTGVETMKVVDITGDELKGKSANEFKASRWSEVYDDNGNIIERKYLNEDGTIRNNFVVERSGGSWSPKKDRGGIHRLHKNRFYDMKQSFPDLTFEEYTKLSADVQNIPMGELSNAKVQKLIEDLMERKYKNPDKLYDYIKFTPTSKIDAMSLRGDLLGTRDLTKSMEQLHAMASETGAVQKLTYMSRSPEEYEALVKKLDNENVIARNSNSPAAKTAEAQLKRTEQMKTLSDNLKTLEVGNMGSKEFIDELPVQKIETADDIMSFRNRLVDNGMSQAEAANVDMNNVNEFLGNLGEEYKGGYKKHVDSSIDYIKNIRNMKIFSEDASRSIADWIDVFGRVGRDAKIYSKVFSHAAVGNMSIEGDSDSLIRWVPYKVQEVKKPGGMVKNMLLPGNVPYGYKIVSNPSKLIEKIESANELIKDPNFEDVVRQLKNVLEKSAENSEGGVGDLLIESNVARMLTVDYKRTSSDILKLVDGFNNLFKRNKLTSLGFNIKNAIGVTTNMVLSSIKAQEVPGLFSKADEVFKRGSVLFTERAKFGDIDGFMKTLGEDDKFLLNAYETFIRGQFTIPRSMKQSLAEGFEGMTGTASEMQNIDDLKKMKIGQMLNPKGKTTDIAATLPKGEKNILEKIQIVNAWGNETMDGYGRMAVLIKAMQDPDYMKVLGVSDPVEAVRISMFNPKDLSTNEREVMRRLVPFYTFAKMNLAYHMQNLPNNAVSYHRFAKASQSSWELMGINKDDVEDYKLEQMYFPLPGVSKNGKYYAIKASLPQKDIMEFISNPLSMVAGASTPLIKAPFELATGKTVFSGGNISNFKGERSTTLPFLNKKDEYMLGQTGLDVPLRTLTGVGQMATGNMGQGLSQFTGMGSAGDINAARMGKEYEALTKLQDGVKYLKQEGIILPEITLKQNKDPKLEQTNVALEMLMRMK